MSEPLLDPIPGILDLGGVTLLNGSSGIGKTALTAAILAHLRTATHLFGYPVNTPTHLAYVAVERAWDKGSKHWFDVAGFPDISHYSVKKDRTINLGRMLVGQQAAVLFGEMLIKCAFPPGTLLVVDPFALFLGNVMNPHLAAVMLIQISRLLEDAQISALCIMHNIKEGNDPTSGYKRANENMGGSGWLSGYSDAQLSLRAPEQTDAGRYELIINPHNLPGSTHAIPRNLETGGFFIDQAELVAGRVPQATIAAESWPPDWLTILEKLQQATCSTGELINLYAVDCGPDAARKRVERALNALKVKGYVKPARKGYWTLLKMPTLR